MTRLRVFQPGPAPDPQTFLDALEIAEPCRVPWAGMAGDDRVRFCGQCRQNVYDVAAMSRDQAAALIRAAEGRICLRLTRRADGTVTTADCWTLLRQARRRGWLPFAGMLVVLLWAEIAAQVVGLWSLGRLMASRRQPAPTPAIVRTAPAIPAPRPAPYVTMGVPPLPPTAKHGHSVGRLKAR